MTMGMTRFALCRGPEHGGHVVVPLNVGLGCKIQISPVGLRLTGECILQILLRLTPFERHIKTSINVLLKKFPLR
jgi:hypothetical protein